MKSHKFSTEIEKYLHGHWPCSASQIVKGLGFSEENRSKINLVTYHLREMDRKGKIKLKKIGRNLVAWPIDIEKIRFLRDFLGEL